MAQAAPPQVVVIGCGAIGLPLAAALAAAGAGVLGIDTDRARLAELRAGRTSLIEPGLPEALVVSVAEGRLSFADSPSRVECERAFVIAVPTPASAAGGLDDAALRQAMSAIAAAARPGDLVCVRSTVPIGATRALAASHAALGLRFAACPDRSVSGRAYAEQFTVPHVVGGADENAGAAAARLFAGLGPVVRTADPETAEAIKLFANAQRDVSFALANQFALICEASGVDFASVREAGARGFPRFALARPGPVGGPCLTKDLALLLASNGVSNVDTGLLQAARALNESLADRTAAAVEAALSGRPPVVAVLGLAFKGAPPTADQRGAFAGALAGRLRQRLPGLQLRVWDPVRDEPAKRRLAVEAASVVVLANEHPALAEGLAPELADGVVVFDLTGVVGSDAPFAVRRLGQAPVAAR